MPSISSFQLFEERSDYVSPLSQYGIPYLYSSIPFFNSGGDGKCLRCVIRQSPDIFETVAGPTRSYPEADPDVTTPDVPPLPPSVFGNLWINLSSTFGKIITGFSSTFTNGLMVDWGNGASTSLTSNVSVNHTLGYTNFIGLGINNAIVTKIDCGTSLPRLGGTVDISAFPNLKDFRCNSNDITAISGYQNNANLTFISIANNKITGNLPSFAGTPNLRVAIYANNLYTGTIPEWNAAIASFNVAQNQLTGSIPNFINNRWIALLVHENNLTGGIPPALSNQNSMVTFSCHTNASLGGSIPNINTLTQLQRFLVAGCGLTGSIPNLTSNINLTECWFHQNNLTGSIPSLSTNNQLTRFLCQSQQGGTKLTTFAGGSVPNTLGEFQAYDNQLTSTAVNAILAAFVAANKTTGTLVIDLGGTGNAAPTGQGITDRQTLINRGWRTLAGSTAITN